MKYPKTKYTPIGHLAWAGLLLGLAGITPLQAESLAQSEIRAQAARFWGIAEDRVVSAETAESDKARAESCSPVHSRGIGAVPPPSPPPTVTVRQAVDQSTTAGHFGFSLFGGLRLFDFDWGETRQREHDSLDGRL